MSFLGKILQITFYGNFFYLFPNFFFLFFIFMASNNVFEWVNEVSIWACISAFKTQDEATRKASIIGNLPYTNNTTDEAMIQTKKIR